jgi:translation initiation factor eIF-2B subunit epsilon
LDLSDGGSVTSSEQDSDSSDDEDDVSSPNFGALAHSSSSLPLDTPTGITASADARLESEFKHEVELSLERAFAEGHSVDNAAVELKTLRMASNVPLVRVREAVVGAIVERINIVEGGGAPQRKEITSVVSRWGNLINQIGGVDAVETVSVLQVGKIATCQSLLCLLTCIQTHCASSERMPLFGQILAALYQDDVVEEDDIRQWHALPASKGLGLKPGTTTENIKKCWLVGARMITQFNQQDSDGEEDSE